MIRLTGCGSPAEDTKTSRPAMPVNGVCPPGLSQSKPQTPRAERRRNRRSVVTAISCAFHTRAWGQGLAESPTFRAPLAYRACPICQRKKGHGYGRRAHPRRQKNQGRRSFGEIRALPNDPAACGAAVTNIALPLQSGAWEPQHNPLAAVREIGKIAVAARHYVSLMAYPHKFVRRQQPNVEFLRSLLRSRTKSGCHALDAQGVSAPLLSRNRPILHGNEPHAVP